MATLLVIDDSPAHRLQVRQAVGPAGLFDEIVEAGDGVEGLKRLLSEPVDVVLCDFEMPGLDGGKLLQIKESHPQSRAVPLLFLSGNSGPELKVRLLEGGACDLIEKPFHPAELVARLGLHLKIKRLQDELREKNEMLSQLSATDGLTGLRARRYVMEVLQVECLRAQRYGSPLALVMADVDDFKRVNDEHGHPVGDSVLCRVADRLRQTLRATDTAGRLGGDELVVVMPQNTSEGAAVMAERWRERVEAEAFEAASGSRFGVTISVGVAPFRAGRSSPDGLLAAADGALYRAKEAGRNRVVVRAEEGDAPPEG